MDGTAYSPLCGPLRLRDAAPAAVGKLRSIYTHPLDTALLVKVIREDILRTRWQRWPKRLPRALQYTGFAREMKEYIAMRARHSAKDSPICRIVGFVETDLGMGLLSEIVRGDDAAGPGPTLAALCARQGLVPWMDEALSRLFGDILDRNVIVGDLHPSNIVHGYDSQGGMRLVVVDGFGEKNIIPRCSMSRAVNRWNTRHVFRRLRTMLAHIDASRAGGA